MSHYDAIIPYNATAVDVSSTDFDCTDTATFDAGYARRIYIGGTAGDVVVTFKGGVGQTGNTVTYKNKAQGTYVDGAIVTVVKEGTTATLLVAEG